MNKKGQVGFVIAGILILIIAMGFLAWGMPKYKVYSQTLQGKADLEEAKYNRQIAIEEAEAEKASAFLKAEADIIRAGGIAEANKIISESLTDRYIRWKWVEGLHDGSSEIIYVATEANLPILEATRLE